MPNSVLADADQPNEEKVETYDEKNKRE
jgi:hypothetical protein